MKKWFRIALKLLLIVACTICFLYLLRKDTKIFRLEQPAGEGITVEDVEILMQAFDEKAGHPEGAADGLTQWLNGLQEKYAGNEKDSFLYGDYIEMVSLLSEDKRFFMEDKYNDEFYLLKKDWYESYEELLKTYGLKEKIKLTEISVLAGGNNLTEESTGEVTEAGNLLSAEGRLYPYLSSAFQDCFFAKVSAYVSDDRLLTVKEQEKGSFTLENIWLMEVSKSNIQFFFSGYEVTYDFREGEQQKDLVRESIADFTFGAGSLKKAVKKDERVSGRLLRLSEAKLELQNKGTYDIDENCKVYQLYEELREAGLADLRIGYDFADYVLADGKICAVLIMRKENMESIRVAIRNNGFQSLYHDSIEFSADCEMELIYGPYEKREVKLILEGEKISVDSESDYLKGDRIELAPSVKSGRIQVFSLNRNQGTPEYRGKMEIVKTDEGLILINELLLEEYLYSVVPSEMPASYPAQALRAQAVCARTYAYRYLIEPGLADIGAHVDDSVNYQVYNNIAENVNSTKAVKETTGILLYYGAEAVSTFYYSTSCGFGTDAGVWSEDNREKYPYLSSVHIAENSAGSGDSDDSESEEEQEVNPLNLVEEEYFRNYILTAHDEDYEKDEPWYRWEYEVQKINVKEMSERLKENFTEIYDIYIAERREGGAADKLVLETDAGTFEVKGEYNIRYILNNGGSVVRQDGSKTENGTLLPSAYLIIDVVKSKEDVIGYTIFGGGYGHGVGMSQNGAKAMGNRGMSCEEILSFFYPDCQMKKMY